MKKKIVLWAQNEKDEKFLLGLELLEKENKVLLYRIPEADATEDFYKSMMNDWKEDKEFEFPASHTIEERKLSLTDDLLPDEIKTDRTDVISRAKAEWHFVVLSSKLYDMYQSEVDDLKQKVESLSSYDDEVWEEMKSFWDKVQNQVQDRNLFRDHANALRKHTNGLFDTLKELKNDFQKEFKAQSKEKYAEFNSMLDAVQEKIDKNLGLRPIFDELKSIQNDFKNTEFSRDDRNKIWTRLDGIFKTVKEKKFGGNSNDGNNPLERLDRRYKGLLSAIGKMDSSINYDKRDLEHQLKRIEETHGQLERELGKAKVAMIQERIDSKQEKLDDMLKTKEQLEKQMEKEKQRAESRAHQEEVEQAKVAAKEKIAKEMEAAAALRDDSKLADIAAAVVAGSAVASVKAVEEAEVIKENANEVKAEATEVAEMVTESVVEAKNDVVEAVVEEVATPTISEVAEETIARSEEE